MTEQERDEKGRFAGSGGGGAGDVKKWAEKKTSGRGKGKSIGTPKEHKELAREVADAVYADSNVDVPHKELATAIRKDAEKSGKLMKKEHVDELVMGDDDGDTSKMAKRYPNTAKLLVKYLT